jgi:uncharacterized membrane protein HdeD (DUF308 family)
MDQHLSAYSQNAGKFFLWGILLMMLGVLAISTCTFTTLVSVMVLGFFLLFAGCVVILDTFTFWHGRDHGFVLHLLAGILYLAAGLLLLSNPIEGSISITFLLGVIYTVLGLTRIFFSTALRLPYWGWTLSNGIITLLIGILILMSWPASSLFIIGLFVGIDIFFCGLAYTMASVAASKMPRKRR